jgi:hypothetical protein
MELARCSDGASPTFRSYSPLYAVIVYEWFVEGIAGNCGDSLQVDVAELFFLLVDVHFLRSDYSY